MAGRSIGPCPCILGSVGGCCILDICSRVGVILADSSTTLSNKASCFIRLAGANSTLRGEVKDIAERLRWCRGDELGSEAGAAEGGLATAGEYKGDGGAPLEDRAVSM